MVRRKFLLHQSECYFVLAIITILFSLSSSSSFPHQHQITVVDASSSNFTFTRLVANATADSSGLMRCRPDSDRQYVYCSSVNSFLWKGTIEPFARIAKTSDVGVGFTMQNCDIYQPTTIKVGCQPMVVCPEDTSGFRFYLMSTMALRGTVNAPSSLGAQRHFIVIDNATATGYATSYQSIVASSAIFRIKNLDVWGTVFVTTLLLTNSGDTYPSNILLIEGNLYIHLMMSPARITRVSTSAWVAGPTVSCLTGESTGMYENMVNDSSNIYLSVSQYLVKFSYKPTFQRVGVVAYLSSYISCLSMGISPDFQVLISNCYSSSKIVLISIATGTEIGNWAVSSPIFVPWFVNTTTMYTFSNANPNLYIFRYGATYTPELTRSKTVSTASTQSISLSGDVTNSNSLSGEDTNSNSISSVATQSNSISSDVSASVASQTTSPSKSSEETVTKTNSSQPTLTFKPRPTPTSSPSELSSTKSTSKSTQKTSSPSISSSSDQSSTSSFPTPTNSPNKQTDTSNITETRTSKPTETNATASRSHTAFATTTTSESKSPLEITVTKSLSPSPTRPTESNTVPQVVPAPQPVLAPASVAASASVAAAAGGILSGDAASPTTASRALSLAAVATACTDGVIFVPSPPADQELSWPQGSLLPQIQIALPTDDPKDSWRRHFRGAILANFVVFPAAVLPFVAVLVYGLRFTSCARFIQSNYLFAVNKGTELEKRAPDLIADSRLFGVILFLFGLGLEGATCAFVTLLATPRATNASLGIDIFLSLLGIIVVSVGLFFLLKVVLGAREKLECLPTILVLGAKEKNNNVATKKSEETSSCSMMMLRFLFGNLAWTFRQSLEGDETKSEEAKQYFLRFRNLFASNQGPQFISSKSNNNNNNSFARQISMYAAFVDCFLTFASGCIRGLTISGVLACSPAVLILVLVQIIILLWNLLIRSSLYPITKICNIILSSLLLGASVAMVLKFKDASSMAVSAAMLLSFAGMFVVVARYLTRKLLHVTVCPVEIFDGKNEKMRRIENDDDDLELALLVNSSSHHVAIDDEDDDVLSTAPHSPAVNDHRASLQPLEINDENDKRNEDEEMQHAEEEIGDEDVIDENVEIDLSMLLVDDPENEEEFVVETADEDEEGEYELLIEENDNNKEQNDDDDDDEQIGNKITNGQFGDDAYQSETKESRLKRLLEELDEDEEVIAKERKKKEDQEAEKLKKRGADEKKIQDIRKLMEVFTKSSD